MGLILGLAAGLLAFLLTFRPGGMAPGEGRRPGLFALSVAVYLAITGLFFVPLALSAADRVLTAYVVTEVAVLMGVAGAFAGGRRGAAWWLMLAWPVPFITAMAARFAA